MRRIKILIVVKGGVVQEIRAEGQNARDTIEAELLDWDNVEAGDTWNGLAQRKNIQRLADELYPHQVAFME